MEWKREAKNGMIKKYIGKNAHLVPIFWAYSRFDL